MKTILFILFQSLLIISYAQVEISGIVITKKGEPVSGTNLFLQGTYDGCTSDSLGNFHFKTLETGSQMFVVSFVGYETTGIPLEIGNSNISGLEIILKEAVSELDEVVINAGTFEASDKKKSVILKPLDIALTAGANGDIFGAFGTLPGSHVVGEEGRLFVRGGESYETKTFMDGMLIHSPYYTKTPDLPTRGRFSPLLFNGMVFSTGGYSAEFGQALSSIVALNTTALEPETKSSISVLTVGAQGSHAKRWKNSSLALTGELLHTGLSNKIFKQNIEWIKDPVIAGSTLMYKRKTSDTGMIKTFGSFSFNTSSLMYDNFQQSVFHDITITNNNTYLNSTYNELLGENWMINTGLAINFDKDKTDLSEQQIFTTKKNSQAKVSLTHFTSKKLTTKMGVDFIHYDYNQDIAMDEDFLLNFSNNQFSSFVESEIKVGGKLAFKAGLRAEHSSILTETNLMPRLSAAVKTGKSSQLSVAFGQFRQNPEDDYLKFSSELSPEKSTHSIFTYQYKKDSRTLRIEAYNKDYSNLIKFEDRYSFEPGNFTNDGFGYSRGFDVFWRDQKTMGKSDYWISYSWNDSKRDYMDFPVEATPYYISEHNLSVVYKKFFTKINTFGSATYSFASGRPYYNPNNPVFMADRTKSYNDISFGITHILYLFNTQTVLHLIVNNALGFNNIYGYIYSDTPDDFGVYNAKPVTPPSKRMAVLLISFLL
ncbi:MAG: TonB-dependent receptor [Bacteroidetes bacterium]|nr:TonB-dependent receptor [Bacteroidota bacterium]